MTAQGSFRTKASAGRFLAARGERAGHARPSLLLGGKGGSEALVTADHAERRRRDGGQPTFWHRRAAPLAIGGDVA